MPTSLGTLIVEIRRYSFFLPFTVLLWWRTKDACRFITTLAAPISVRGLVNRPLMTVI
ncbi:hypothetical protein PISMIDRAFT_516205 [Pisolithus microcarpus 441]|uniref:Uncharacterized protein n=1 Tax=Pisolithus microcarpus 441 TaxID=765257 RepID=A0A0C9YVJ3_9AGAM|nr:hypothetical protein PISMIDRAFT_516205 [Pisolithus microcarpus 441]